MKLLVGLGNPGNEYKNTRHNVGFMVLDNWMNYHNYKFDKKKFNGEYSLIKYQNEDVIVLKPLSFMNLSGTVVLSFVNYFKINIDDILIVYDDKDIELGSVKLKKSGSCGGHNGIRNIIDNLKTNCYILENETKFFADKVAYMEMVTYSISIKGIEYMYQNLTWIKTSHEMLDCRI